ncbi:hypothetical protein OPIT5_16760 [Opitutaceae bacterium TAV5]|nr:hypothetical protein OPIT5_16760 [Opitutaceae bacterium TAV5]
MKTEKNTAPAKETAPMLRISLHGDIVIPATADINSLLRILMGARKVETVTKAPGFDDGYTGNDTRYMTGPVIPTIAPLTELLFDTEEEATAARVENYHKEKAEHEAYLARRAAREAAASAA